MVDVASIRADGSALGRRSVHGGSIRWDGLESGTAHTFSVTAAYLVDGQRCTSEPVTVRALPRGTVQAPRGLTVRNDGSGGLHASWQAQENYAVELWLMPLSASIRSGERVTEAELRERGARPAVSAVMPSGGERISSSRIPSFPGIMRVVPAARLHGGYVMGEGCVAGLADPVTGVHVDRLGEGIRVSWEWPPDCFVVDVAWTDGTRPQTRRVTRAAYQVDGGVLITGSPGAAEVTLTSVVGTGDVQTTSPPVAVAIDQPRTIELTYDLDIRVPRWSSAQCTVTVLARAPVRSAHLQLVMSRGAVLPIGPHAGDIVADVTVELADGRAQHTVDLGRVKPGFWMRLFSDDPRIRLHDPSTSRMKG